MPDREKYIDIFEQIVKAKKKYYRNDEVPIRISYQCVVDILDLLKEQEEVEPTWQQGKAYCGSCGKRIPLKIGARFCHKCGQAVKWK